MKCSNEVRLYCVSILILACLVVTRVQNYYSKYFLGWTKFLDLEARRSNKYCVVIADKTANTQSLKSHKNVHVDLYVQYILGC